MSYFFFRPQYIIIIITSTCVEDTKKIPVEPGEALAEDYFSEKSLLYYLIL
jgi:hypothetical protein